MDDVVNSVTLVFVIFKISLNFEDFYLWYTSIFSAWDPFNFDADPDPNPGSALEKMDPDPGH